MSMLASSHSSVDKGQHRSSAGGRRWGPDKGLSGASSLAEKRGVLWSESPHPRRPYSGRPRSPHLGPEFNPAPPPPSHLPCTHRAHEWHPETRSGHLTVRVSGQFLLDWNKNEARATGSAKLEMKPRRQWGQKQTTLAERQPRRVPLGAGGMSHEDWLWGRVPCP